MKKTLALIILDGVGISNDTQYNAIAAQGMPKLKKFFAQYPNTHIKTSGLDVGLPDGQMGNSEVGHLNIGAGRVVYQDITAIDKAIKDGDFFVNSAFLGAVDNCVQNNSALHLIGLLSDGGVHSSIEHLYALLKLAKDKGLTKVYLHCIADGRDVPPKSVLQYISKLQTKIVEIGVGELATIMGRYYIMDRDNRWERVKLGYDAIWDGIGQKFDTIEQAVTSAYDKDLTDEFVPSSVVGNYCGVKQNDSIIFFNFRADRARQISRVALDDNFVEFERKYKKVYFVGFTQYDVKLGKLGLTTAFAPKRLDNTLGEYLAKNDMTQVRIAETEKYAHVTFFFNGGVEELNKGETRILVPSPKVATYDLQPEMSAAEVTQKAIQSVGKYDVMIINYANCDMVGHTAKWEAAIKAVKTVDDSVDELLNAILHNGGSAIVTADHGNIEQLAYQDGSPCTSHTTNQVPLLLVGDKYRDIKLVSGSLCDIAPTMLHMLGLQIPQDMEGVVLIDNC